MPSSRVLRIHAPDGAEFAFAPGALCLAFAVTGGEAERTVYETLHAPEDLQEWLRDALEAEVEPVGSAGLAAAKGLREAVWACALARATNQPLPGSAVDRINLAASAPPPVPRIDRSGSSAWRTPVTVDQALSAVAREAIEVFTGPWAARIRQCQGVDCTLLFVDTSRPGMRRWCSMERCGNRSKIRAFRQRRREESQT